MMNFPVPDGQSREFMRNFGVFPVILVNCELDMAHTSTQELYPLNHAPELNFGAGGGTSVGENKNTLGGMSFTNTPGANMTLGNTTHQMMKSKL